MKTTKTTTTRIATKEDFKTGSILIDAEGNRHIVADKYHDGIWNTRSCNVVFEGEARFYHVAI